MDDKTATTRRDEQTEDRVRVPRQRQVESQRTITPDEPARRGRAWLWAGAGIVATGAVAALVFIGATSGSETQQAPGQGSGGTTQSIGGGSGATAARQLPCHPGLACAW